MTDLQSVLTTIGIAGILVSAFMGLFIALTIPASTSLREGLMFAVAFSVGVFTLVVVSITWAYLFQWIGLK